MNWIFNNTSFDFLVDFLIKHFFFAVLVRIISKKQIDPLNAIQRHRIYCNTQEVQKNEIGLGLN